MPKLDPLTTNEANIEIIEKALDMYRSLPLDEEHVKAAYTARLAMVFIKNALEIKTPE
jgi:hypothetical protein